MHLSGEVRYSGRTDILEPSMYALIEHVCHLLGVPGLHKSLVRAGQQPATTQNTLITHIKASYRFSADKQKAVRMQVITLN
jgi:hypothetical protein